jgi:hypothetical protein
VLEDVCVADDVVVLLLPLVVAANGLIWKLGLVKFELGC